MQPRLDARSSIPNGHTAISVSRASSISPSRYRFQTFTRPSDSNPRVRSGPRTASGEGCLFHWARVAHDGLHGVDVWDTQQHFDQFAANVLGPAVAQVGMSAPQTKSYDIHAFLTAH